MKSVNLSIRQAFADTITDLAVNHPELYVVSVDLKSSLGLSKFASKFRSRFIEAGISENNAAAIAAGLAKTGKTVFLTSFACFSPAINWNVIKQSICYNHLNVKIIGSHAGLMTADLGATHQMLEDIALMRPLPHMEVFAPVDAYETKAIVTAVFHSQSPAYIRLVRPPTPAILSSRFSFTIGKSVIIQPGTKITLVGYGPILYQAVSLNDDRLEIINCSSIKPLDSSIIISSLKKTGRLIVLEDHQQNGGLGQAIAALVLSHGLKCQFIHLAVDDQFGRSSRDYSALYRRYGLDSTAILFAIKKMLK